MEVGLMRESLSLKPNVIKFLPLFFACKREGCRAKQRQGESIKENAKWKCIAALTHPDIAALVGHLSRKRQRGL
jgi:hypothetical protein